MTATNESNYANLRLEMVELQLRQRDIVDDRVLEVMSRVPRHEFVPPHLRDLAYGDFPLPLADGQTISQPYIVALMSQLARARPDARVLEIGVGSGYQTAVLAELCGEVFGLEIIPHLAQAAEERLRNLGYRNVMIRAGDGSLGWPEHAPYDVILVAASPPSIPQPLLEQLALGGRLVLPVGDVQQYLTVIHRTSSDDWERFVVTPVMFVPMVGEVRQPS
ncbi:MAG: protein-L-isoaspartate(D-aspartate) O-methyltransferase [Pirellulales bacterium]